MGLTEYVSAQLAASMDKLGERGRMAVAAGALGALALALLLRRRALRPPPKLLHRPSKRIAAGHAGSFEEDSFFFKLEKENRFESERNFFERVRASHGDPIAAVTPEYHGVETREEKRYLKMKSLIERFDAPTLCLMDVKMGVRCMAEDEMLSKKPRKDLYAKLLEHGIPITRSVLTAEEVEAEAITKSRWMILRDQMSSTQTLGFRVDSVVTPTRRRKPKGDLATCRTEGQVVEVLRSFLPPTRAKAAATAILQRLGEIERSLRASEIFFASEVVGSSLFFAADDMGNSGVWMLDFGITLPADVPSGRLKHDVQWERGNHEDGYLIGLDSLQKAWQRVIDET